MIPVNTFVGINTMFPVSAYDPFNAQTVTFVANWGDGSQEQQVVGRASSQQYFYGFQKTYEFPGTYLAMISAYRNTSLTSSSPTQLATYNVVVTSLTANEPLPTLKVMSVVNFVNYRMFTLTIDDDGVLRSWNNKIVRIPVSLDGTVLGFLSAAYSSTAPGTIGISLTANQVANMNWPLNTSLNLEILETDNNEAPPVTSLLFKGYLLIYETANYSAIFM